ncbi:MAG: hypothetical protein EOO05_03435 [Chitinophagaceae bacterium]|nr:MAG: hypothetical protein EOO05_03435 [Chitinophagaceae bacterium]
MTQSTKKLKLPATLFLVTFSMSVAVASIMMFPANRTLPDHQLTGIPDDEYHHPADEPAKDSAASVAAFAKVYKVLMSPRCMNCHPSGDIPLQGDNSQLHSMSVKRGKDGKGIYAAKCANCHQPENTPGKHTPPGNPEWHLPPADMKMVFQGRTPRQLALQLLNPKENGNKTKQQLIDHATADKLVLGGWNPGEGRTLPPLSHKEFADAFRTWIEKGAFAPAK